MKRAFTVEYGVDNSHLTEVEVFDKLKEAENFFDDLPEKYPSALLWSLQFNGRDNSNHVCKWYRKVKSEGDNTAILRYAIANQI